MEVQIRDKVIQTESPFVGAETPRSTTAHSFLTAAALDAVISQNWFGADAGLRHSLLHSVWGVFEGMPALRADQLSFPCRCFDEIHRAKPARIRPEIGDFDGEQVLV